MKKILISLITIIAVLQLCSCDKKDNTIPTNNDDMRFIDLLTNNYEEGRIVSVDSSKPVMYLDYKTMKRSIVCAKPNCSHHNNDCVAEVIGRTPLLVEDGIYFFNYNDGVKELKNGKREHYINSKFCHVSLDSSEITDLVQFTDCAPADYNGILLYKNKIYFIGDDLNPVEDEYGYICTSNVGGKHFLCSIDLETNEYTNYGAVYDNSKLTETGKNDNSAILNGMYGSKMYITYKYCNDYDNLGEDGIPLINDVVLEFDPETKELKQTDLPKPLNYLTCDTYIYYDDQKEKTIILTKDEKTECEFKPGIHVSFFNNKLFGLNVWYDLTDGSTHNFDSKYLDFEVMDYYDGYYIMGIGAEIEKVSEEELMSWK